MITKKCLNCGEEKELSDFYINNKKLDGSTNPKDYNPWCKKCFIKRAGVYQKKHKERHNAFVKYQYHNKEGHREYRINIGNKQRESGYQSEWRKNNKDKMKKYGEKRNKNKAHKIKKQEWDECLTFFNNSCAYCGMTMEESIEKFGQKLNKEHVDHNGSNRIDNCVPACKSCNSSKHTADVEPWFKTKKYYEEWRLKKIREWISNCKMKYSHYQNNAQ